MTTNVEKSITVEAPVSAVYDQWTQFEEFPQFMGGVQEVRQLGDSRIHWMAEIAGVKREWDATILEQVPDQKIAWAATEGATNAGLVHFSPVGSAQTVVTLSLEYEPEGLVEQAGDQLNIIERRAGADLEKFKEFIESRGTATGGWRGSVNEDADIQAPGVEAAASSRGDSGKAGMSAKAVIAGVAATAAVAAAGALAGKSDSDSTDDTDQATDDGADTAPAHALVIETKPSDSVNDDDDSYAATGEATTGSPITDAASQLLVGDPAAPTKTDD